MKKTLISLLALLLVAVTAVTLVACSKDEAAKETVPAKKDPVSQYKAEGFEKSTLKNQVSWEGLNQFKSTKEIAELYKTDPQTAIKEAEGQSEAILMINKATAEGIRMIKEAGADESVIKLKSLEAFTAAADGQATKIIIPSEIQGLAGLATSVKEFIKE